MNIYNYVKLHDSLALSGQPSEQEIAELIKSGVKCIVNFAPQDKRYSLPDEKALVEGLGAKYIHYPIDFANPTTEDFLEFERIVKNQDKESTLLHCAANYRVSALYANYAYKNLGWSITRCDELISSIWNLDEFPLWLDFNARLRQMHAQSNEIITRLLGAIEEYLVCVEGDAFRIRGTEVLARQLSHFVSLNSKLCFVLPGFPCKSPNIADKSFSQFPDFGEVMAIERLQKFCDDMEDIYPPGAEMTIVSDGATFSDLVHVDDKVRKAYNDTLRQLTLAPNIAWAGLTDIIDLEPHKLDTDDKLRSQLVKVINTGPRSYETFVKRVKQDKEQAVVHDKLCSYLYHDVCLESFAEGDRDKYLATISEKAYQMMYRGRALSRRIEQTYPDHIRLSVHQYDNSGPKFTISLSGNKAQADAPWHKVPVRMLDGEYRLLSHSMAKKLDLALVTHDGRNWLYLEVPTKESGKFSFEIVRSPSFGLRVNRPAHSGYDTIPAAFLQQLSTAFGFLILENSGFSEQDDLVRFSEQMGDIYQWNFGPVHVVKPELKPHGFVHSIEKTPLHWDLSMLPLDHERVAKDPLFTATSFLLYCKTPPAAGEGQTTLVDSRKALQLAGHKTVKQWQQTDITYSTKMTYFGGVPRTYPLVLNHPLTGDNILRFQEGSDLAIQTFDLSSDTLPKEEFSQLVADVTAIAYDDACFVAHDWQADDLLIVDNYYCLHGRLPMTENSMSREIWRVQVI
jgi:pyoverdine/dityrosine biosynthesis protein Dit1/alpha-ketoglutarate-dependent taurine dioxygenase/protein tyrosine phosphatase (PTP) superfamily phosphohydrolase (DUF442 family)